MRKKAAHHPSKPQAAKRYLCLLMLLVFGALSLTAAAAEPSASERMVPVRFTDYEELYFAILDITAGPETDTHFDSLPGPAQALYIAAILDMEVQNGGLCQFFINGGSVYAARAAQSLQEVGLAPMKTLYESFVSENQIDPAEFDTFHSDKVDAFLTLYDRYPFDDFDDAYMKLWEELDFNNLMPQYANDHPEAFQ